MRNAECGLRIADLRNRQDAKNAKVRKGFYGLNHQDTGKNTKDTKGTKVFRVYASRRARSAQRIVLVYVLGNPQASIRNPQSAIRNSEASWMLIVGLGIWRGRC